MSQSQPRDLWVWQSEIATDSIQKAAFFQFASTHFVRNVYLESEGLIQTGQRQLASFIAAAATKNIGVYLLFGNASWALTAGQAKAVQLAQLAASFSHGLTGPRPLGVQYDVEPHQLAEWSTDLLGVEAQYVSLVQNLKSALQGSSLTLTMTVPFWFWHSGYDLTLNGVTKHLDQWVLTYADQIAIMDFRNTTSGVTGSGVAEVADAQAMGKKAIVGLEVQQDTTSLSTSFYSYFFPSASSGRAFLDQVLNESFTYFTSTASTASGFSGFAVEDYGTYLNIDP